MSQPNSTSNSEPEKRKLSLERDPPEETLVIETGEEDDEVVLASNSDGSSLTLLEEYSIRKTNNGKRNAFLAFLCAAASVTFAFMIFKTL